MENITTKAHEIIVVSDKDNNFKRRSNPKQAAQDAGFKPTNFFTIQIKERDYEQDGFIIPSTKAPVTINVWENNSAEANLFAQIEAALNDEKMSTPLGKNKKLNKIGYDCKIMKSRTKPYYILNTDGSHVQITRKTAEGEYKKEDSVAETKTYLILPGESQEAAFVRATSNLPYVKDNTEESEE